MTTISVPLPPKLEELIEQLINRGYAPTKAEVVRKALELLAEEDAVASVLKAQQEIREGKGLRGNLRKLAEQMP